MFFSTPNRRTSSSSTLTGSKEDIATLFHKNLENYRERSGLPKKISASLYTKNNFPKILLWGCLLGSITFLLWPYFSRQKRSPFKNKKSSIFNFKYNENDNDKYN